VRGDDLTSRRVQVLAGGGDTGTMMMQSIDMR
jgi:hypothetical protein